MVGVMHTAMSSSSGNILDKYDQVKHVGSTIMWQGQSYMSKPGEVLFGVNSNNDLVAHYYKNNATVIHHVRGSHPKNLTMT